MMMTINNDKNISRQVYSDDLEIKKRASSLISTGKLIQSSLPKKVIKKILIDRMLIDMNLGDNTPLLINYASQI